MANPDEILAGITTHNAPAEYQGQMGFWVQSSCVFITADRPEEAIEAYRRGVRDAEIGISHNWGCASINLAKYLRSGTA